jgi:hypothetical protein
MMDNNLDNLKRFMETIKTVGFWTRLFGWRKISNQLVDASADLQKLISINEQLSSKIADCEESNYKLTSDFQQKKEALIRQGMEVENLNTENKKLIENAGIHGQTITDLGRRKNELESELAGLKRDHQNMQDVLIESRQTNTRLLKDEEFRKNEHSNAVSSLTTIQAQIYERNIKEQEEKNNKELERVKALKETWSRHQENAQNLIKAICQKHTIQYLEKVPFKGDPDNTLLICDEYVVFDAKSPGSDDLTHFPAYLKDQAEKAIKYARLESVKSDIYFVVPSNTLESLELFVYRHGEHNVYIISADALEPVILGLKKIEEYEFAKELSPEERDNICRILGRFAHLSKRRIQVDSFFAKQFIELAYKCETNLPKDLLDSIIEFEKAEKLNPPVEKRVKAIPIKELEKDLKIISQEAEGRGIVMEGEGISLKLNEAPLYRVEK